MDFNEKEFSSLFYLFVPSDLPRILKYSHLPVANIPAHDLEFDISPWLVVDFLEPFMNYVIDTNIVFEYDLVKAFAWSTQGCLARKWYYRLQPKEIKYFPQLMKRFQNDCIMGYEDLDDIYVVTGMQRKMGYEDLDDIYVVTGMQGKMHEKLNNLNTKFYDHPSKDLHMAIEERSALNIWFNYVITNYAEPSMQNP